MTKQEFAMIAAEIKSLYPKEKLLENSIAMNTWYELLQDLPYEHARIALRRHASTSKWSPTVADIRQQIVEIQDESSDWGEAWKTVMRAIGRYGTYREGEALESMDELTRESTRRLGWKMICQSEQSDQTALRANFRKIYEQMQQEERDKARLPQSLQQSIARITGRELPHESMHELRSTEEASGMPRSLPGETGRTESNGL